MPGVTIPLEPKPPCPCAAEIKADQAGMPSWAGAGSLSRGEGADDWRVLAASLPAAKASTPLRTGTGRQRPSGGVLRVGGIVLMPGCPRPVMVSLPRRGGNPLGVRDQAERGRMVALPAPPPGDQAGRVIVVKAGHDLRFPWPGASRPCASWARRPFLGRYQTCVGRKVPAARA